ncbi:MAG: transglycosylase SLT domain-containing protein [Gemmatimonadales bacterium]
MPKAYGAPAVVMLLAASRPSVPVQPAPAPVEVVAAPVVAAAPVAAEAAAQPVVMTARDSVAAEAQLSSLEVRRGLERYFARFNDDRVLTRRIATAVVRESVRQQVPSSLIAAVLVTENTTLIPHARSQVGARGLMQVMPMHAGRLGCGSGDLVDVDSNICHGTKILARNLRTASSHSKALLRYNGCVRGTNTPDCWKYPSKVLKRAGRVRKELLAPIDIRVALR